MNCKHAAWLMSLRQDRPLKLGEDLGLRLHLSYCPGCRAYRQQLDFLHSSNIITRHRMKNLKQ